MSTKYKIIYADPPWTYAKTGGTRSSRGMAKQFYPTMTIDEICSLPIREISDTNCLLFLWCPFPQIPNGLKVIKSWGFEYFGLAFLWIKKTNKGKDFFGMGYWTRTNPEPCFLAIRGKMKPHSHGIRQLIYAPIQEHSKKPAIIRNKIIELCGDLPRIELFARPISDLFQKEDGWDVWGNEVESDIEFSVA